jgi:hypothetical protein
MPRRRADRRLEGDQYSDVELDRIITLSEATRISTISADSWRRHHRGMLVRLTPRRIGVRLRHALMLSGGVAHSGP